MYKKEEFEELLEEISKIKNERIQKILRSLLLEVTENNKNVKESRNNVIYKSNEEKLKERKIFEEVTKIINEIGMPANLLGYKYIREGIKEVILEPEKIQHVTKVLYPSIAKKFGTTPSKVERAIRHAIEVAWFKGNIEICNTLFGYSVDLKKGKTTNSEFIANIGDKIRFKFNM